MIRTMTLLLVAWALLLLFASSCTHVNDVESGDMIEYNKDCTTQIELRNGTKFEEPEDSDNMVEAEEGCVRNYGQGSCLTRFIKTGKLSYYAICRRGT